MRVPGTGTPAHLKSAGFQFYGSVADSRDALCLDSPPRDPAPAVSAFLFAGRPRSLGAGNGGSIGAGGGRKIYFGDMPAPSTDPAEHPIVFFDGVCALCNGFVDFVIARDRRGRFRIAALQGETAMAMGAMDAQPGQPSSAGNSDPMRSLLLWDGERWYRKSDAALRVVAGLDGAWKLSRPLLWFPRNLRDTAYDFIARNRYRWFGKREACRMPTPSERERFLP